MSNQPLRKRPLLAVLIDADNMAAKHAGNILEEIKSIGEPALRRVYGDWSQNGLKSWQPEIHKLGLSAHQVTATSAGKNATDIGMVIDAMDLLHSTKFDGFVIVSSDGDFTSLANRLREEGKLVISIGEEKAPTALRVAFNQFITIQNIEFSKPLVTSDTPSTTEENATEEEAPKTPPTNPKAALGFIKQAISKMEPNDGWYSLGQLGNTLRAAHPDFDSRSYGCASLSQLIRAIPKLEYRDKGHGQTRERA